MVLSPPDFITANAPAGAFTEAIILTIAAPIKNH
nr:MAG TPA: hypothetical protein [Caudoviricetes sp.]